MVRLDGTIPVTGKKFRDDVPFLVTCFHPSLCNIAIIPVVDENDWTIVHVSKGRMPCKPCLQIIKVLLDAG